MRSPGADGLGALRVALPASVLLHATALGLLLLWLSEHPPAPARPGPLTVTLIPSPQKSAATDDTVDGTVTSAPSEAIAPDPLGTGREAPESPRLAPQSGPRAEPGPPPTPQGSAAGTPEPAEGPGGRPLPRSGEDASANVPGSAALTAEPRPLVGGDRPELDAIESAYLTEVRRAVEAARYYPRRARRLGQQGTVELRFEILRDGRIAGAEVRAGSGSRSLDSAALDILDRVGRFAPLPERLDRQSLMVQLPVDYRLY